MQRTRSVCAPPSPSVQLLAEAQKRALDSAHLNIYITRTCDLALQAAEESDARRARGQALSELDGVPVAVKVRPNRAVSTRAAHSSLPKDNFCMQGVRTTAASHMLRRYVPSFEVRRARCRRHALLTLRQSTVTARLRGAGAVIVGKTNMVSGARLLPVGHA